MNIPSASGNVNTFFGFDHYSFFIGSVPSKPYASDTKDNLRILPKTQALEKRYIQYNQPNSVEIITLDLDYYLKDNRHFEGFAVCPHIAIVNPENGHSHIMFCIDNKIFLNNPNNRKPANLLSAVEYSLVCHFNADRGFSNLVCKNPLHPYWEVVHLHDSPYSLYEIANALPKLVSKPKRTAGGVLGYGRNLSIFEEQRFNAYNFFNRHHGSCTHEQLFEYLCEQAFQQDLKDHYPHLPIQEQKQICKSIAKWVIRHFSPNVFSDIQSRRGVKSGKVRLASAAKDYHNIMEIKLSSPHYSIRDIAKIAGCSIGKVQDALKHFINIKNDSPLFDNEDFI
jgi:hypothetical protein